MKRKVYLEGEMGERFGKEFDMVADSFVEVFRCLKCNFSGFMPYLQECHEKNIGFLLEVEGKPIKHEAEALLLYKEGDMIITPLPAGSKSGAGKLLAAVAITVMTAGMGAVAAGASFSSAFGSLGAFGAGLQSAALGASGLSGMSAVAGGLAQMGLGLGINLAIAGIQQMMAPDPSTDNQQDESYIFEGSKQNIAEGDPVPVLYGELRIPGRTVSFHTRSERTAFYNHNSRALSSENNSTSYSQSVNYGAGGNSSSGNGGINYYLPEFITDPH